MTWGAVAGAAVTVVGGYLSSKSASDAAQGAADSSSAASRYAADLQKQEFDQQRQDQMPWLQNGTSALNRLSYLTGVGPGGMQTKDQIRSALLSKFTHGPAPAPFTPTTPNSATSFNPATYGGATGATGYGAPAASPVVYAPAGGPNNVDDTGLNAAVDKAFAAQHADPAYGSLTRNFSNADFQTDPGYQFRLQQGMNGLNNSLAAKGGLLSGAAVKEAMRLNQGYATDEYGNAYNRFMNNQSTQYNRLASLAGVGQNAANTLGQAGTNYANSAGNLALGNAANYGNAMMAGATLRGSAYQGAANALGKVDWSNMFSSNNSNDYATQTHNQGIF